MAGPVILREGDFFWTGYADPGFLGRAIRTATRSKGELPTQGGHSGSIVQGGTLSQAVAVEAFSRVLRHPLLDRDLEGLSLAIYRVRGLTAAQRRRMVDRAEGFVGKRYGYHMLLPHLGDWALDRIGFDEAYFFRRLLTKAERYAICSWVSDHVLDEIGLDFGQPIGTAAPDHQLDHVQANSGPQGVWKCVRPFGPLRPFELVAGAVVG